MDKGYPGQEDLPTPLQSDTLSIALLVLSKSRASGNIIFPTSQSDGKGFLSGPVTVWYNLLQRLWVSNFSVSTSLLMCVVQRTLIILRQNYPGDEGKQEAG